MRRGRLPWVALSLHLVAAAIAAPSPARAEEEPDGDARAVILVHAGEPSGLIAEAQARLEGELGTRGFRSAGTRITPGHDRRAEIEQLARGADVLGAIGLFMDATGEAVEVWVFEGVTGKTLVQAIDVRPGVAANPASAVSVRAVELLRASLLELDVETYGARGEESGPAGAPEELRSADASVDRAEANPLAEHVARSTRRRWAIDAGGGAMAGIGDGGPTAFALVRVAYRGHRFGARIGAFGPLSSLSISGAAGTAELRRMGAFAELLAIPWRTRVHPMFGVGVGVQHLLVRGLASAPYEGRQARLSTPYLTASVGVVVELLPWIEAWVELGTIAALTAPRVRLYDERTAPLGRVSVVPALGLSGRF